MLTPRESTCLMKAAYPPCFFLPYPHECLHVGIPLGRLCIVLIMRFLHGVRMDKKKSYITLSYFGFAATLLECSFHVGGGSGYIGTLLMKAGISIWG